MFTNGLPLFEEFLPEKYGGTFSYHTHICLDMPISSFFMEDCFLLGFMEKRDRITHQKHQWLSKDLHDCCELTAVC